MIVLGRFFLFAVLRCAHPIEILREPIAHSGEFIWSQNACLFQMPRCAAHFNQMQRVDDSCAAAGRDAEDSLRILE